MSNLPGLEPPPKFSSKKDQTKNNDKEKQIYGIDFAASKSKIDTLPRHTAGSLELSKMIKLNKEKANNTEDSDADSLEILKQRFKNNGKDEETSHNLNNKQKKEKTKEKKVKGELRYDSSSTENSPENFIEKINKKTNDATQTNNIDYEMLNKKRHKIYSNLISLNEIENKQKSKILEQERQLEIQNMKIKDALIIHKSLTNFNTLSNTYDYYDSIDNCKYARHEARKASTYIQPVKRKRVPLSAIQFPTIVTKYEPQRNYEHSLEPVHSRKIESNLSYYRPHSREHLYTKKEENIPPKPPSITLNQTFQCFGEPDVRPFNDVEPKKVYESKLSPDVEVKKFETNNYKYEIIKPRQKNDHSTLKSNDIKEIIKLIEETDKQEMKESSYFVNDNLIKRTRATKDNNLRPSFTISEKLYKMYLDKKKQTTSPEQKTVSQATFSERDNYAISSNEYPSAFKKVAAKKFDNTKL